MLIHNECLTLTLEQPHYNQNQLTLIIIDIVRDVLKYLLKINKP